MSTPIWLDVVVKREKSCAFSHRHLSSSEPCLTTEQQLLPSLTLLWKRRKATMTFIIPALHHLANSAISFQLCNFFFSVHTWSLVEKKWQNCALTSFFKRLRKLGAKKQGKYLYWRDIRINKYPFLGHLTLKSCKHVRIILSRFFFFISSFLRASLMCALSSVLSYLLASLPLV